MILIDMDIPERCGVCFAMHTEEEWPNSWCGIDEMVKDLSTEDIKDRRPEWCPIHEVKKPEKPGDEFETAYFAGFDYGGQMMLKEIIKMLKGMRWYGGDKPKKRTD